MHTPNLPKAAQNTIQSLEMPLRHREAAERECTEAKRRVDSAKPNPQGAQASAREPERSELTFLRLLPERAFTFERGAEEFAKSYRINLRLLPELAFSSEHDAPKSPPPLSNSNSELQLLTPNY